jgi:hypothetical protein
MLLKTFFIPKRTSCALLAFWCENFCQEKPRRTCKAALEIKSARSSLSLNMNMQQQPPHLGGKNMPHFCTDIGEKTKPTQYEFIKGKKSQVDRN